MTEDSDQTHFEHLGFRPRSRRGTGAVLLAAFVALALLAACKTRRQEREELDREIASYAPRVAVVRSALQAIVPLVPDSRTGTPELGPLDPPLEMPGGNAEVFSIDDLTPRPEGQLVRPFHPWGAPSTWFACLETSSADDSHYSISSVERLRRECDRTLALKYAIVVRDVFRREPNMVDGAQMESGSVTAEAFVFRIDPPALVASFAFHAASSWTVDYTYDPGGGGEERMGSWRNAAREDLQRRAVAALRGALGRAGAIVDTPHGMDPAALRPVALRPVAEGWRRGAVGPASFDVPTSWESVAPDRPNLLADWRARSSDGTLAGHLQLEWRKRDFESIEQFGALFPATLAQAGTLDVTRGTTRDAGGREWLTFEGLERAAPDRPTIRRMTRVALSRDRESAYMVHCFGFVDSTEGGASACPTILDSLVAHD